MSTNICVGNFPFSVTSDTIEALFTPYGTVESVKLLTDRETGRLRGFGFVEMASGGEEAIAALNQHELDGRTLTVNPAKPSQERERTPRPRRG